MARDLTAYGLQATLIAVPATGASALLIVPIAGEISSTLKYVSGGSMEIMQAPVGTTAAPTLGTGYLMDTGEALAFDGAPRYYIAATGSTAVAYLLKGLSQGF